jgi:hypothetical protein
MLWSAFTPPSLAELMATSYCLISDSLNMKGQVPVFISPMNKLAHLYLRALGSLLIASCDSQGYGGGILTRLRIYYFGQSQSHVTTDGQSVIQYLLMSSHLWFSWPDVSYCLTITVMYL